MLTFPPIGMVSTRQFASATITLNQNQAVAQPFVMPFSGTVRQLMFMAMPNSSTFRWELHFLSNGVMPTGTPAVSGDVVSDSVDPYAFTAYNTPTLNFSRGDCLALVIRNLSTSARYVYRSNGLELFPSWNMPHPYFYNGTSWSNINVSHITTLICGLLVDVSGSAQQSWLGESRWVGNPFAWVFNVSMSGSSQRTACCFHLPRAMQVRGVSFPIQSTSLTPGMSAEVRVALHSATLDNSNRINVGDQLQVVTGRLLQISSEVYLVQAIFPQPSFVRTFAVVSWIEGSQPFTATWLGAIGLSTGPVWSIADYTRTEYFNGGTWTWYNTTALQCGIITDEGFLPQPVVLQL